MIELVFVLVVIGILASIAIPKLSSIQDDAQISSENAGISAIRTSLQALHGKIIINGSNDINVTVTKEDGTQEICTIKSTDIINGYPKYLSLSDDYKSLTASQSSNDRTLALLLEPSARKQWKTKVDGDNIKISGPASSSITDASASINTNGSWSYIPASGTIAYKSTNPF
jgi:type II secretory pathway pseudopilin PulG